MAGRGGCPERIPAFLILVGNAGSNSTSHLTTAPLVVTKVIAPVAF
jgi:hypothetical protein